jgi:hypothetical protein
MQAPDHLLGLPQTKLILSETENYRKRRVLFAEHESIPPDEAPNYARWPRLTINMTGLHHTGEPVSWLLAQSARWQRPDEITVETYNPPAPFYPDEKYMGIGVNEKYAAVWRLDSSTPPTYTLVVCTLKTRTWRKTDIQYTDYRGGALEPGGDKLVIFANKTTICIELDDPKIRWTKKATERKLVVPVAIGEKRVFVGSLDDTTITAFDLDSGEQLAHFIANLHFLSADGDVVASGGDTGQFDLYNWSRRDDDTMGYVKTAHIVYMGSYTDETGRTLSIPFERPFDLAITALAIEGEKVAIANKTSLIMEQKDPKRPFVRVLTGLSQPIDALHIMGDYVITLQRDGAVSIWPFGGRTPVFSMPGKEGPRRYLPFQRYVAGVWTEFYALDSDGCVRIIKLK